MHVAKLNIRGSGLVGLYMLATDDVVIVGNEVPDHLDKIISEVFKVKLIRMTIAGTSLIGAFLATDGTKILVPNILFDREEQILIDNNINYTKITTDLTCLGNNIIATEKGAIINPDFEAEAGKQIEEAFKCPIKRMSIAENPTIGSYLVHNGSFGIITPDVSDEDAEKIEKFLGLCLSSGTIEMGSTQVRSGVVSNKNGYLIGEYSGGAEIVNVDRAFGYSE
jgi:translation initiation factor 6